MWNECNKKHEGVMAMGIERRALTLGRRDSCFGKLVFNE